MPGFGTIDVLPTGCLSVGEEVVLRGHGFHLGLDCQLIGPKLIVEILVVHFQLGEFCMGGGLLLSTLLTLRYNSSLTAWGGRYAGRVSLSWAGGP
jgi:hypothetical protein